MNLEGFYMADWNRRLKGAGECGCAYGFAPGFGWNDTLYILSSNFIFIFSVKFRGNYAEIAIKLLEFDV